MKRFDDMTRSEFIEKYDKAIEVLNKMQFIDTDSKAFANILADELGLKDPKTKIVYEWIYLTMSGSWFLASCIMTEEEASNTFNHGEYKKTGRQFEVPCD